MATKKKIETEKVETIIEETIQPKVELVVEKKVENSETTTVIEEVKVEIAPPIIEIQEESELSIEDKILNFVNSRQGEIKLNPFIKSLYPKQNFNEPEIYLRQGESKSIKHTIQKLIDRNEFKVKDNTHKLLGAFYYNDTEQKTKYNNINNIEIIAEK